MTKNPQPGDYGFIWHPNILGLAIARNTHAKISHVETIIDVGINGSLQVMSAEAEGLVPKWRIPENEPWYCVLTNPEWSLKDRDKLCQWMWDHKKTPYDVWGLASFVLNLDLNNELKVFCSEVCYLGPIEALGYYILDGIDHAFVSPRDLYISRSMKTLDGKPKEVR
jgi:hypothetical protein